MRASESRAGARRRRPSASIYGDILHRHWTPRRTALSKPGSWDRLHPATQKRLPDPSTTNRTAIIPTSNVTAKFPALIGTQVVSDACVYCIVYIPRADMPRRESFLARGTCVPPHPPSFHPGSRMNRRGFMGIDMIPIVGAIHSSVRGWAPGRVVGYG